MFEDVYTMHVLSNAVKQQLYYHYHYYIEAPLRYFYLEIYCY